MDTDKNDAELFTEAAPIFQIMEHAFCIFFAFEWTVRFISFERKLNCFRDAWFVFDSALVFFMVLETWAMTAFLLIAGGSGLGGNMGIMRIARLLRLSRMARMARLFRAIPELLIMIKGMLAATRSVFFTLCLLAIIMYVFGIAFTQLVGEDLPEKFGTVPVSMHTLLLDGTLLDGLGDVISNLKQLNVAFAMLFYLYVLLGCLTVMNMLIGVLCEVVSAVASTEKETILVSFMRGQLEKVWEEVCGEEAAGHGDISKEQFSMILGSVEACDALEEAGVDPIGLVDNIDFIFEGHEEDDDGNLKDKTLSFGDFVGLVLTLRGSNNATVKDIVDLRKYLNSSIYKLRDDLRRASKNAGVGQASFSKLPSSPWEAMALAVKNQPSKKRGFADGAQGGGPRVREKYHKGAVSEGLRQADPRRLKSRHRRRHGTSSEGAEGAEGAAEGVAEGERCSLRKEGLRQLCTSTAFATPCRTATK